MSRTGRPLIVAALIAVLVLVATGVSEAAVKRIASEVRISKQASGANTARGKVSSKVKACVANRKVNLYFVGPDRKQLIGTGRTNARGGWKVSPTGVGPHKATVVKRRIKRPNGNVLVCKGDASPKVNL